MKELVNIPNCSWYSYNTNTYLYKYIYLHICCDIVTIFIRHLIKLNMMINFVSTPVLQYLWHASHTQQSRGGTWSLCLHVCVCVCKRNKWFQLSSAIELAQHTCQPACMTACLPD